ncbi:MAG: cell division protein FtsZ [Deltaproteobacteria bacterium]|nr:cell division protein FtsZ [Deltaproteobacteria bacterium]
MTKRKGQGRGQSQGRGQGRSRETGTGGSGGGDSRRSSGAADAPAGLKTESIDLLEIGPEDDGDLFELEGSSHQKATIKVVGVGGGGGNALNTMIDSALGGVEFIAANTDAQALKHNFAPVKVQLGAEVTRGLGCGANPDRGRASALEARDRLREILEGSDMVFVTAGMGGGTGTGAAPIVAEVAREIGALTVGVVTKPFPFEGRVRTKHSERGIDQLHGVVDTLITIPNQRLLALAGKQTSIQDAFKLADDVLLNAVRGISDLITIHGLINLDFADVRTVMNEAGVALMGTGAGHGDTRAVDAARAAISSPLLEDLSIDGARGVLINITGGPDMTLFEVNEASMLVQEAAHEDANIIFGAVIDEEVPEGELRVTVIATGLDDGRARRDIPTETRDQAPGHSFGAQQLEIENITPSMTRSPAAQQIPVTQGAPAPPEVGQRAPVQQAAPLEAAGPRGDDGGRAGQGFESPFEDEYDTPAFIRRRSEEGEDEDRETPAFLRRAQD